MKFEDDCFLEGKHRQYIEKQRHHFTNKDPYSQGYGLSSSHMWMWELDHNEGCTEGLLPSNCGAGEDLGQQENQTIVNPKGSQPWILNGRADAEAEAPVLWPPGVKSRLIRKDPDARKYWRQEEKGTTEDETVGWHHQLDGHGFEKLQELVLAGRPSVLQSMGSQRVGYDWVTGLNWTRMCNHVRHSCVWRTLSCVRTLRRWLCFCVLYRGVLSRRHSSTASLFQARVVREQGWKQR